MFPSSTPFHKLIGLTLVMIQLIAASTLGEDTLTKMSFEELMNVEVSVASRSDESIYDAPGIVSSYSFADMNRLGYYTLGELADITPGYSSTYAYGERGFETRGLKVGAFNNNRHLVLVDGIPVNHARANKAPTEEELPTIFADQVEFLRGPASALYGNGAYYGVINIIPMMPKNEGTIFRNRLSFGTQEFNHQISSAIAHKSKKFLFSTAASFYQKEASQTLVGTAGNENYRYWDDKKAIFVNGNYELAQGPMEGFGVGMIYMSRTTGLGEHWYGDFSHELNSLQWTTFITYLKYRKEFTNQLQMSSYFKYNRSNEIATYTRLSNDDYLNYDGTGILLNSYAVPVDNFEIFADITWANNPILDITGGFNIDWRYQTGSQGGGYGWEISADSGNPYIPLAESDKRSIDYLTSSAFLQFKKEFSLLSGLIITAGMRGDFGRAGKEEYNQFSPRIALVQRIIPTLNLKAQWGTALAAPGLKELELNNEAMSQNPSIVSQLSDLNAEDFSTLELALVYHPTLTREKHQYSMKAEVSTYYNVSKHGITDGKAYSSEIGDSVNIFKNTSGTIHSSGVESELRFTTDFGVGVFSNYSFAMAYNEKREEIPDIPRHRIQAGVNWDWEKTGLFGAITGRNIRGYTTGMAHQKTPHSNFLDINLGWRSTRGIAFEIITKNLLNGEYHYPIHGKPGIILPRQSFTFTVSAHF